MQEIKITRAQTLKEKPDSSTLVFGKSMTDHMFIVDYDAGQGWHDPRIVPYAPLQIDPAAVRAGTIPGSSPTPPCRSTRRPRCSTMPRRSSRA